MSDFWLDPLSTAICSVRKAKSLARMRRLSWAFAGRLCNKYHNLMSWLTLWPSMGECLIEVNLKHTAIIILNHLNVQVNSYILKYCSHSVLDNRVVTRIGKVGVWLYKLIETLQKVGVREQNGVQNSKSGVNENYGHYLVVNCQVRR